MVKLGCPRGSGCIFPDRTVQIFTAAAPHNYVVLFCFSKTKSQTRKQSGAGRPGRKLMISFVLSSFVCHVTPQLCARDRADERACDPTISLNQDWSEVPGSCVADLALRLAYIRQAQRSANQEPS